MNGLKRKSLLQKKKETNQIECVCKVARYNSIQKNQLDFYMQRTIRNQNFVKKISFTIG